MQILQQILCRGAVDRVFLSELLACPSAALRDYDLSPDEYAVIAETAASSLMDLARAVEAYRRGEPLATPMPELALAG